jgi:hypothetical protein
VQAITFETVIGPVTIRNSEVKNNNFKGGESDDSAVGWRWFTTSLSTALRLRTTAAAL